MSTLILTAVPGGTNLTVALTPEEWREGMVVSPFQARAALAEVGLLDAVEALMADPQTPAVARLAWRYAQEFPRTSPTIAAMAAALGLSEERVDALFEAAAGIVA